MTSKSERTDYITRRNGIYCILDRRTAIFVEFPSAEKYQICIYNKQCYYECGVLYTMIFINEKFIQISFSEMSLY